MDFTPINRAIDLIALPFRIVEVPLLRLLLRRECLDPRALTSERSCLPVGNADGRFVRVFGAQILISSCRLVLYDALDALLLLEQDFVDIMRK